MFINTLRRRLLVSGTYGDVDHGAFLAANQAATMYRITTDYHGGFGRTFGSASDAGGGSIGRAAMFINASLVGANGTFPDLDMMVS